MNVYLGGLYKEVEYIETSGTQYIETPFKTQDGYLHKTKVRYLSFNTNWCSFGGGYSNFPEARFFFGARGDRNQWTWGLGSNFGDLGSVPTGVDYELEAKLYNGSQSFIVNGSTLKTDTFSFSASERYNVCLIGSSYYDATLAWSSTRVYYYQLYDSSNNLVLDMIPCYRLSDNEIGMFDKVNNQFYTNSGTGTFTKGSDIKTFQAELKNAYIGEVWTPGANTVAYYKFDGDSLDYSGNGYNVTQVTSYNTISSGKKVAYFSGKISEPGNANTNLGYDLFKVDQDITISFYLKPSSFGTEGVEPYFLMGSGSYRVSLIHIYSNKLEWGLGNGGWNYSTFTTSISSSVFQHIVLTYNHTAKTVSMYKNGTLVSTISTSGYTLFTDCTWASIGYDHWYTNSSIYLGEMIFEKGARTAEQVANYYNNTKSKYLL